MFNSEYRYGLIKVARFLIFAIATFIFFSCTSGKGKSSETAAPNPSGLQAMFTLSDAKDILGATSKLVDSSFTNAKEAETYKATFSAQNHNETDAVIYLLAQRFSDLESAQSRYTDVWRSNMDHAGVLKLKGFGDEGYFHSDGSNFHFMMFRKGKSVVTIKVSMITPATSITALNKISWRIAHDPYL